MGLIELATKMLVDTLTDGGATYNYQSGNKVEKTFGYWVGGAAAEFSLRAFTANVAEFVTGLGTFPDDTMYVGTWTADGVIYMDSSNWIESLEDATELGKARGEQAIWDIANNVGIDM